MDAGYGPAGPEALCGPEPETCAGREGVSPARRRPVADPQETRISSLAVVLQKADMPYNATMSKEANEKPFLRELRQVLPGDLAREAEARR